MNSDYPINHKFHIGCSRSLIGVFLSLMAIVVCAQNRLPPCVGKSVSSWTGCTGKINSGTINLYTGEFMNGKKHGLGEATIAQNAGDDRYVGHFREGRMHGRGTYYFSNGAKYEGELAHDQFNGEGSFDSPNGDRYVGQFRNGQFSGDGVYTFANGNVVQEGVFENGVFVRAAKVQLRLAMPVPDLPTQFNEAMRLNPRAMKPVPQRDAVAIIIGIQSYKSLPPARFANADAQLFAEYAQVALGVRAEKIRLLTDSDADEIEIVRAFRSWLLRNVTRGKTEVYVFYSGHGLPSDDGKSLYLLPHNADRDFIDKTSINQQELVRMAEATGAKSVTMFLDSCYSGQSRGGDALMVNARPVKMKSSGVEYPLTFTVLTASAPDQISWSSDELGHGIFSYYLMKGIEGDADLNKDGKITFGEMQEHLTDTVGRQAMSMNRKQQPQLFGGAERVLVGK